MQTRVEERGNAELVTDASVSVDALARRLIDRYGPDAIDVALALVRRVNFQLHLGALLAEARARPRANPLSQAVVIRTVCAYFDLAEAELRGETRNRRAASARIHAYALLRARTSLSLSEVGKIFQRHHTTVLAGCERVDRESSVWRELNRRLDAALIEVPQ